MGKFRTHVRTVLPAWLAAGLFMVVADVAPAQQPAAENSAEKPTITDGYLLNPGDELSISVWKDEALNRRVLVLPDGKISFPLVGFLDTKGKTASKVQELVAEKLTKFISNPVVTIAVTNVNGNRIFVIGKVRTPGQYPVSGPVDVMQALSLAGGLNSFAAGDDIRILRRSGKAQQAIRFEYSSVSKGSDLDSNIILKSGDAVVVP